MKKTTIILLAILLVVASIAGAMLVCMVANFIHWLIDTKMVLVVCPAAYVAICAWEYRKEQRKSEVTETRVSTKKNNKAA